MEASAAVVKELLLLPSWTPIFENYKGFRLKLNMLKFQHDNNLKKIFLRLSSLPPSPQF